MTHDDSPSWLGTRMALLLALATATSACGEPSTRSFAVTVTDAMELHCVGYSDSPALEQETLDAIAEDLSDAWEDETELLPPQPRGRVLLVNELRHKMEAWFEPHAEAADEPFTTPLAIYRGDPQEGFLEGTFEDLFNSDEEDDEAGREPCGPRPHARGVLSVTDDDGVLGRIRWTEYAWISSVDSACAGHVDCARDVRIEGLEME
jgi:hypothetical protein